MFTISLIGWVHTFTCVFAMLAGGVALFAIKGSVDHKKWGHWYIYAMAITNLSALLIYPDGVFNIFHWMALGTLAALFLGWYAATRQRGALWANTHLSCMVWSYYMLYGGLINESFLRIPALRGYSPFFGSEGAIFGLIQMLTMLVFIIIWVNFLIKTSSRFKHRHIETN